MARTTKSAAIAPFISLFSLTLFLSAGLMFAVQPMIGKMMLPIVGGSPSGWVVAMAYFQLALLGGYGLAHLFSHMPVRAHGFAVCLCLLVGLLLQPLGMPAALIDVGGLPESLQVFLTLLMHVTLPFVAMAMVSPSLQRVFANSQFTAARNPYFLFAASNLGSFAGLLLYPLWFERTLGLSAQSQWWQVGYAVLVCLCFVCLLWAMPADSKTTKKSAAGKAPTSAQRLKWVLLSFIPSSLLVGVTAHITTDIGSVPFFWIFPLALYLLTFVLAFMDAFSAPRSLKVLRILQNLAVVMMMFFFIQMPSNFQNPIFYFQMLIPMSVFVLTALYCHSLLAGARPAPAYLTEFYLWIAAGGALGGSFNAFVAPFILPLPYEFMIVAVLSGLVTVRMVKAKTSKWGIYALAGALAALGALIVMKFFPFNSDSYMALVVDGVLLLGLLFAGIQPKVFIPVVLVMGMVSQFMTPGLQLIDAKRNFFGVLRVYDDIYSTETVRSLVHGTTIHGFQIFNAPEPNVIPNSYYDPRGPLGDIMAAEPWHDVGVIGMGTAEIVCYRGSSRHYTYYEIDPNVPDIAKQWFDYIRVCGVPEIKIGDGRKLLAAATSTRHDLLIVDAFTSDAIPVHLLTKEAVQTYFDRMLPDGLVAFHVSNRYYDLLGPLSNIAQALGLKSIYRNYSPDATERTTINGGSQWVVFARTEKALKFLRQRNWQDLPPSQGRLWTDDFSNLLLALRP